jgi:hypothetical protein
VSEFYVNLAVSVILQMLQDGVLRGKFRRALLKIFRAIALQFREDPEFLAVMKAESKKAN